VQVGFFDIVALPLFQSFAQAFADAIPMLDAVKDNYAMWREEAAVFAQVCHVFCCSCAYVCCVLLRLCP
jgi:hypothetical protein